MDELPAEIVNRFQSAMENALALAAEYAAAAGRDTVLSKDVEIALKYVCRYLYGEPSVLDDEDDEEADEEEEDDDEEDEEEEGGIEIVDEESVEWTPVPNEDEDNIVEKIHLCYDLWEDWDPPFHEQRLLKEAIDRMTETRQ